MMKLSFVRLQTFLTVGGALIAVSAQAGQADLIPVDGGFLQLTPVTSRIIHVAFAKDKAFFSHKSFAVVPHDSLSFTYKARTANSLILGTPDLYISVDRSTGHLRFEAKHGGQILTEEPGGRVLEPAVVQGEKTYHVQQKWLPNEGESLYGLGENQQGLLDLKGFDLDLWQHNTQIAVPFLVSSKGYGILWDNPSFMRFGDLRPFEPMPTVQLIDKEGKPGGLTASYFAGAHFDRFVGSRTETKIDFAPSTGTGGGGARTAVFPGIPRGQFSVKWEGTIVAPVSGDYQFQAYSHSGIKLWLGGRLLMDHWRQSWLPWIDLAKVHLVAGQKSSIRVEYQADQGQPVIQLKWKTPSPSKSTSLWSEVGEGTDYYFVYGPSIDKVISGYRELTGQAPIMPKWSFGLFQSRQRYETQKQSLDVIDGFRSRNIPFDTIVQDWFYWQADAWGSHEFDRERFPDPVGWIDSIHEKNAHLMISVWPKFFPGTDNFEAMNSHGYLFQPNLKEGLRDWTRHPYTFYDAFNPDARKMFWSQASRELLKKNIDAWWMDASEPDLLPSPTLEGTKTHMNPTAMGTASRVLNAYPLVNAEAIYEGQRKDAPDKRVFILTRSGYAGQQRFATASWSGDTSSTWTAMRKQITAGLSFSISGIPYWTMDSGGFSVPARFSARNPKPEDVDEWRELNTRWFEFATFVPFLRVHGEAPFREMWQFGGDESPAYKAQLKFDNLRYTLLPYIYSLAGMVNRDGGTIMRPLVLDFQDDPQARNVTDQYMFGPSILVCPVTDYKVRSRMVYLPYSPGGWYSMVGHEWFAGGQTILANAPYDQIPVFLRAGGIIPTGPVRQFVGLSHSGGTVFQVLDGARGKFTLYDDDGLTYRYEKGEYSAIPIQWNNSTGVITIGPSSGSLQGGSEPREFRIELVRKGRPTISNQVVYSGKAVSLKMR